MNDDDQDTPADHAAIRAALTDMAFTSWRAYNRVLDNLTHGFQALPDDQAQDLWRQLPEGLRAHLLQHQQQ